MDKVRQWASNGIVTTVKNEEFYSSGRLEQGGQDEVVIKIICYNQGNDRCQRYRGLRVIYEDLYPQDERNFLSRIINEIISKL